MSSKGCRFTFHYGSILMNTNRLKLKGKLQFTFHYGSILIPTADTQVGIYVIYIPLWFYSNNISINILKINVINLHSTMVLF